MENNYMKMKTGVIYHTLGLIEIKRFLFLCLLGSARNRYIETKIGKRLERYESKMKLNMKYEYKMF